MRLTLAAIRSGTDPAGPLPPGSFHRWLEEPLTCPKCHVSYGIVVDYDHAVSRHFAEESRRHLAILRKAIMLGHSTDHRVTHFETNGVTVISHASAAVKLPSVSEQKPLTKLVN